ncbi:MAG: GrpB family protein [Actinomycetota bacterium]|nr:GrpB family protein [Actinomycetota bacterium]
MSAKPVIDIQVSVPDHGYEDAYVPALRSLGMTLRSRERDRRYLRPGAGSPRTVQFHVCDAGSKWERDHLLFRDYLRSTFAARDTYDRAKHEAAATWRDDRIAYSEAKTGVILDLLEEAEEWANRTAWRVRW